VRHHYQSHYHAIDTLFHTGELNADRGMCPHANLFQGGGALKTIDFSRFKPQAGKPRSNSRYPTPLPGEEGAIVKTLLETRDGVARDPEVYFDGKKIVFALRRDGTEDYHIWEINAHGTGLRQLTLAEGVSDVDPIYLPDDSIVFSSTREPKYNMCSRDHGANLFRMEADGANIHQIGKNNLFDNQPSLMPDGRILYARWEYVDRNFGDAHALWTVNPDGSNQSLYWKNNTASPAAARAVRLWLMPWRRKNEKAHVFSRVALLVRLAERPNGPVFLKLFKNVVAEDLEMLLPFVRIRMRLLDHLKIGSSVAGGVATASWKVLTATILSPWLLLLVMSGFLGAVSRRRATWPANPAAGR
jgi:hypothetical protein